MLGDVGAGDYGNDAAFGLDSARRCTPQSILTTGGGLRRSESVNPGAAIFTIGHG